MAGAVSKGICFPDVEVAGARATAWPCDSDHLRYIWPTWSLGVLPIARKPLNGTEEESRGCLGTVEASGRGSGRATGISPLCQFPALPHRDTAFLEGQRLTVFIRGLGHMQVAVLSSTKGHSFKVMSEGL